jgi:hydroxyethylthiazole kinase-like uncharacterized protein yjeF
MIETNHPDLWRARMPWPGAHSHKHSRGRLGVVAGDALHTVAARLAARAGLRAGAGVVTVLAPPDAGPVLAVTLEAVMLAVFDRPEALEDLTRSMDAVVVGPAAGLAPATAAAVEALSRTGAALVIDADALTIFRDRPGDLFDLLDHDDVLTPHEGEFERLFPGLLKRAGRETAAREAARQSGAVVVLKGFATVVAAPDGRARVNANGSPWLATAGTGDVLSGLIGGLAAQAPAAGMDLFDAACAGVWIHAEAAGRFGPGLIAEDLPDLAPGVLSGLLAS